MPETAARKKSAAKATETRKISSAPARKTGAASAPKKQKPKVDPYDDPFASASKKSAPRKKTSPKKKSPGAQDNPLMRRDPYDDPWADQPRKSASTQPRKSPTRARKPANKADAYDEFDLPAKPRTKKSAAPQKTGGSHGGKGRKKRGGYLTFIITALIVICSLVIALQLYNYADFIKMRNAVSGVNFFAGTTIDGVDVSDMTIESALSHWDENIEPAFRGRTVNLDNGSTITAADLGYSSDYRDVLAAAWRTQTTGSLESRYKALRAYSTGKNGYKVTRTVYTDDAVTGYVAALAAKVDSPMKEPSITGFDNDALSLTFAEGKEGRTIDQAKLVTDIKSALDNGGGNVAISYNVTQPTTTVADMQTLYGLRAYAVTNASSSNSNRLTNIKLALASINGTLLQPGEEFSFNDVVGKRTSDRGYKVATAYNAGEVTEELGGGICQVSTTLFNAVVKSDLTVTERHNHSIPVSYVDKGKDAAVSWGNQDLKFINDSTEPVYIVALLDSDKRVRIGVFGRLLEDGRYITVEAKITYSKDFETTYQYNAFLLPGDQLEVQSGRNTYEAMAYKLTWSADGELLSKEELCESNYRGRDAIIEYGP